MIAIAVALGALVLALLAFFLVLIGANREAPWTALDDAPPTPLAGFARVVMGVYVRRDEDTNDTNAVEIRPLAEGRR